MRRRLSPFAWLPWLLALLIVLTAESLGHRLELRASELGVIRCAAASAAILLLATRRHWNHDSLAFEAVGSAAMMPAACLAGPSMGAPMQTLLVLAVSAGVPCCAAWRFLPDRGQEGSLWPWIAGLKKGCILLAASVAAISVLSGCAPRAKKDAPTVHALRGQVVSVDAARNTLLVHHEEIPGFMPSMTMPFSIVGADAGSFKEGDRISASLVSAKDGEYHLESLRVIDPLKDQIVDASALALVQETAARGQGAFREVGEKVPSFTLLDQDNQVVSIENFRGKRVVLNFIYTRCPVASMCPASTAKMMALQAEAAKRGIKNLQLISISLDPAYDTPAVLKQYSKARGIDNANFAFLTGPEKAVRNLMVAFGILAVPDGNLYKHTQSTVLIDESGKIVFRADGADWRPEQIVRMLQPST